MDFPKLNIIGRAIFLLLGLYVFCFVWPTIFRFDHDATLGLIRTNRVTGTSYVLTNEGWEPMRPPVPTIMGRAVVSTSPSSGWVEVPLIDGNKATESNPFAHPIPKNWQRVKKGMPREEVMKILGDPTEVVLGPPVYWDYGAKTVNKGVRVKFDSFMRVSWCAGP